MAGRSGRRGWGYIRQLPSKRYQASYIGPDLLRHKAPTTFSTRMDAEGWLVRERRKIELDIDSWRPPALASAEVKAKAITLGEYARTWIEQRSIKPRTRSAYNDLLRLHLKPQLGAVPLKSLTGESVRAWYAGLGTKYPRRNSHAYGLLHAVCVTAVADGLLASNPCTLRGVMNPPPKRKPVILDVPEVAALANVIKPERLKALVLVSAWCGLRWGEVSELRRRDVGDDCQVLHVDRAVTRRDRVYRVDTPKSGKGRAVVVPPHIRTDLQAHLTNFVGADKDALLFPAARGGHMNDRVFSREYFADALKSIGREGIRIHDLRHFSGTQTARVGNLVETMARLGHSTVRASLLYQQIVSGRDVAVAEALSKLAEDTPGK